LAVVVAEPLVAMAHLWLPQAVLVAAHRLPDQTALTQEPQALPAKAMQVVMPHKAIPVLAQVMVVQVVVAPEPQAAMHQVHNLCLVLAVLVCQILL
jgi:hypothetical protein